MQYINTRNRLKRDYYKKTKNISKAIEELIIEKNAYLGSCYPIIDASLVIIIRDYLERIIK